MLKTGTFDVAYYIYGLWISLFIEIISIKICGNRISLMIKIWSIKISLVRNAYIAHCTCDRWTLLCVKIVRIKISIVLKIDMFHVAYCTWGMWISLFLETVSIKICGIRISLMIKIKSIKITLVRNVYIAHCTCGRRILLLVKNYKQLNILNVKMSMFHVAYCMCWMWISLFKKL